MTPEEWDEAQDRKRRSSHKRSSSVGQDSVKEMIKAHLAKRKEGSRNKEEKRTSPVHGNHLVINTAAPLKSVAIPVPHIPKPTTRIRGSVEGLNQEIERLVLTSGTEAEDISSRTQEPTPDGHRAPINELLSSSSSTTRTVDTQTPSGVVEEGGPSISIKTVEEVATPPAGSGDSSPSSQSESPSLPIIPGQMDHSRPSSQSDSNDSNKDSKADKDTEVDSPDPKCNFSFVREPPDGAEKVCVEERRPTPLIKEPLLCCPILKKTNQPRIPSDASAFCPLYKPYVMQSSEMALRNPGVSNSPLPRELQSQ